jgi:hypothetical protein
MAWDQRAVRVRQRGQARARVSERQAGRRDGGGERHGPAPQDAVLERVEPRGVAEEREAGRRGRKQRHARGNRPAPVR